MVVVYPMLVNVLHRGADHEIRFAVGILQLHNIGKTIPDISSIGRLPCALHISRSHKVAKFRIEDAAAEGALQGMTRSEGIVCTERVDMVVGGMLPVADRSNLLRAEIDDTVSFTSHESPLADIVIQLDIEILVVGMVDVISNAILLDRQTALKTCCNPKILGEDRSGIFYHRKRIGGVVLIREGLAFFLGSAIVADMFCTQGEEDARTILA